MDKLTLEPKISPKKTKIYFDLNALVDVCKTKRGAIFADASIADTHGAILQKLLGYELIRVPRGEKSKSREMKESLENELMQRGIGRDSTILAMGGGVTTDLVGFIAATYMRGVPLVLMPTTLLAMVDAAIGGKTGIDTPFGKNLIGAFYLPKAILIDLDFLKTLPEKELKNGLSEVLKYGLVQDAEIWKKCHLDVKEHLPFLVERSVQCKVEVCQKDFEEKTGLRRILNFGHTVGHALELISNFTMSHGEAVALGCMAESFLSNHLGLLSKEELNDILKLYRKLGYGFKELDEKAFLKAIELDKKAKNGKARFVLIDRIGNAAAFHGEYCTEVSSQDLNELVHWMKHGQY